MHFDQNADVARLTFANGSTAEADVVIAADGIQSELQKYVVEPSTPEYSGSRAYRGLVARAKLPGWRQAAHQIWMGDGKHFMVFPVRRGELLNYVGFVPTRNETVESWSAVGDRDELAASFSGWDPRVVELIDKIETCFWWGLYDRHPLAAWTKGRLALLGDAAHAMLPHLGQGANQAIEDGVALAVLLEGSNGVGDPRKAAALSDLPPRAHRPHSGRSAQERPSLQFTLRKPRAARPRDRRFGGFSQIALRL